RALESTERSLRNGLARDAQQQEQSAGRGITQLREGIEKAAEAVLGDETEALRRAREELQNLFKELNDEIQQNDPSRQTQPGTQQDGQLPQGENQPGQRQPGQQQPGQQSGELQPGPRQ